MIFICSCCDHRTKTQKQALLKMALLLLHIKKITLLFLLISASLLSASLAGRGMSKPVNRLAEEVDSTVEEKPLEEEDMSMIHERLLKANTKDYGRYDPSPTLVKPPFKLIPN